MYSQTVIPAKAGIQGLGASFDKLRACPGLDPGTNDSSVYIPLSAHKGRGNFAPVLSRPDREWVMVTKGQESDNFDT